MSAIATRPRLVRSRIRTVPVLIPICFAVIGIVIVCACFGSLIAPLNPGTQDLLHVLQPPTSGHLLGTDSLGRDVLSRVIVGARTAFIGPLVIALGAGLAGSVLGLLGGYYGGSVDAAIMRYVDLMFALPALVIVVAVGGTLGGGYWLAVALFVVLATPHDIRLIRAATLEQVPRQYVEAAKTLGLSDRRIMFRHIWPNVSSVAVAQLFLSFATALVGLSAIAFLGFGQSPVTPDWGQMLANGAQVLFVNPLGVLAPAAAIVLTATSMNLIGDWMYERLTSKGVTR